MYSDGEGNNSTFGRMIPSAMLNDMKSKTSIRTVLDEIGRHGSQDWMQSCTVDWTFQWVMRPKARLDCALTIPASQKIKSKVSFLQSTLYVDTDPKNRHVVFSSVDKNLHSNHAFSLDNLGGLISWTFLGVVNSTGWQHLTSFSDKAKFQCASD